VHLNEFNKLQIEEMKKFKWIESEKIGHDLGEQAVKEWIKQFSKSFREHIENINGKID